MNLKSLVNKAPWKTAQMTGPRGPIGPDNPASDDLGLSPEFMDSDPEMEARRRSKEEWIEVPLNPGEYELLFGEEPSEVAAEFGKKLHEIKLELRLPSLEVGLADGNKIAFKFKGPVRVGFLNGLLEQMVSDVLTPKEIEKPMLFASAPWKK